MLKPPDPFEAIGACPSIFLAGSIELGQAENWQRRCEHDLADLDVAILNPRRDRWDWSGPSTYDSSGFREQVDWELEGLERSTLIALHLVEGTKSPVSLLELGLHARSGKILVSCPRGFWRHGNVAAVAQRYGLPLFDAREPMMEEVRRRLAQD
ncbi:MAG: nucleoside 2-deoxyribosyltransferase domain-containing protein [Myxococcota bacterium]